MPQTTNYELITTISSSTLPTLAPVKVGNPTTTSEAVNRAYFELYGFNNQTIHAPVQTVQNCKDISSAVRQDKMLLFIDDLAAIFAFDSSSAATGDDLTIIEPTTGSGRWVIVSSGAGGGGSQIKQMIFAESVNTDTNPKALCAAQKNCLYMQAANGWLDINETGTEYSTQIITVDKFLQIYDLGAALTVPTEAAYDYCAIAKTALNANPNLTLTYDVTYSPTTRKITYSASSNFSILFNTGTHAGNMVNVGFDESSNKTGATTYTADFPIELATEYTQRAFLTQTDASYIVKSRNYIGMTTTNGVKGQSGTVQFGELGGFTLTAGEKYYTKSARIVIETNVNDALDWKIGAGVEINSTIPAGTYIRGFDSDPLGFRTLNEVLIATMEADSADNFTWYFDKNTEKFTCIDDSSNSITFLFGTGVNVAKSINTTIGWTAADTSSATTHTSVNRVEKAGQIGLATDSDVVSDSVYAGFASDPSNFVASRVPNGLYNYEDIYSIPHDWQATPTEFDAGAELNYSHQHFNSSGVGAKIYVSPTGSPSTLYIRKSTNGGLTFSAAATTISLNTAFPENWNNGSNIGTRPKIHVDENGHGIIAYAYFNGTNYDVYQANSTDLNTWATGVLANSGSNEYQVSIACRDNKAVILMQFSTTTPAQLYYSDNSGSGYTSWSSAATTSGSINVNVKADVKILYFPAETGINKYRIVFIGCDGANNVEVDYWKGDLTSRSASNIIAAGNGILRAITQDQTGLKNRLSIFSADNAGSYIRQAESNEDYNGGVLSWNTHALQDIYSGTSLVDLYIGNTGELGLHLAWNHTDSAILVGDYCYYFVETGSNSGGKRGIELVYTKNITGGTWENATLVSNSGSIECVQASACYIPSSHSIAMVWKEDTVVANAYTEGKIFGRLFAIEGNGSLTPKDIIQIDGGEATANFQGWLRISGYADGACAVWEHYDGSTRDVLWYNVLR